jgi:hypothetical protein
VRTQRGAEEHTVKEEEEREVRVAVDVKRIEPVAKQKQGGQDEVG